MQSSASRRLQAAAVAIQQRSANRATEDQIAAQANPVSSGRYLRGLGRRALAFQGVDSAPALAPTLAG